MPRDHVLWSRDEGIWNHATSCTESITNACFLPRPDPLPANRQSARSPINPLSASFLSVAVATTTVRVTDCDGDPRFQPHLFECIFWKIHLLALRLLLLFSSALPLDSRPLCEFDENVITRRRHSSYCIIQGMCLLFTFAYIFSIVCCVMLILSCTIG